MQKTFLCTVILGIFVCASARGSTLDCVKFLRSGDERICMKQFKETSPSIATLVDGTVYYASLTEENRGHIKISYEGTVYSAYNRDEDYELIHWLSGNDALVDGVWRDKVAIGGAMDFVNHGCTWNASHDGYYSSDGLAEYFETATTPALDFGTDWYVEVIASVGTPLATQCPIIDLASWFGMQRGSTGDALYVQSNGAIGTNTKPGVPSTFGTLTTYYGTYRWNEKSVFVFGNYPVNNQSTSFLTFGGIRYLGLKMYDTVLWKNWSAKFYLFRGLVVGENDYRCGPTTIYDVKVWRRK